MTQNSWGEARKKFASKPNKEKFVHNFVRLLVFGITLFVYTRVTPGNQMPYVWVFVLYVLGFVILLGLTIGHGFNATCFALMWLYELVRHRRGK